MEKSLDELEALLRAKKELSGMLSKANHESKMTDFLGDIAGKFEESKLPEGLQISFKIARKLNDSRKQILEEGVKMVESKLLAYDEHLRTKSA